MLYHCLDHEILVRRGTKEALRPSKQRLPLLINRCDQPPLTRHLRYQQSLCAEHRAISMAHARPGDPV